MTFHPRAKFTVPAKDRKKTVKKRIFVCCKNVKYGYHFVEIDSQPTMEEHKLDTNAGKQLS
jgi:hypothetical protein